MSSSWIFAIPDKNIYFNIFLNFLALFISNLMCFQKINELLMWKLLVTMSKRIIKPDILWTHFTTGHKIHRWRKHFMRKNCIRHLSHYTWMHCLVISYKYNGKRVAFGLHRSCNLSTWHQHSAKKALDSWLQRHGCFIGNKVLKGKFLLKCLMISGHVFSLMFKSKPHLLSRNSIKKKTLCL